MMRFLRSLPLLAFMVGALSPLVGTDNTAMASSLKLQSSSSTNILASDMANPANPLQAQVPPLPLSGGREDLEDAQDCFDEDDRDDRRDCLEDLRSEQFDDRKDPEEDIQDCLEEDDRDDRRDCLKDLRNDYRDSRYGNRNRPRPDFAPRPPLPIPRNSRSVW